MKKYLLCCITICFASICLYNCSQEKEQASANIEQEAIQYPNKDSELALLMRDMYTDSEKIRTAVINKQLPPDFREKFKNLHTAIPTDAETKNQQFDAMGTAFLGNMDMVYQEKDEKQRIKAFNVMVQNCIGCHQTHCPGPIKRIKKLKIN